MNDFFVRCRTKKLQMTTYKAMLADIEIIQSFLLRLGSFIESNNQEALSTI